MASLSILQSPVLVLQASFVIYFCFVVVIDGGGGGGLGPLSGSRDLFLALGHQG